MVGDKLPELAPFEKLWGKLTARDRLKLIVACEALLIASGKLPDITQFEANDAAQNDSLDLVKVDVAQKLAQLYKKVYEEGVNCTPIQGITARLMDELEALKH